MGSDKKSLNNKQFGKAVVKNIAVMIYGNLGLM